MEQLISNKIALIATKSERKDVTFACSSSRCWLSSLFIIYLFI